ncbi:spore coat protein CotJB [Bacillus salacetis]|uniref:Spore coat protein CotJB n=1 Tax=Bacillus salacetis TaxID=2315464 RepID=A0A3A1RBQ2_9BACI|nr:spore coat protein CotJB [Bacillus salacetis]RIW38363.1 spore coat protein CotJB [Bacillus salacetis]
MAQKNDLSKLQRLFEELQAVQFVLLELNLYLDTHPEDRAAIQQFNSYVTERRKIEKQIEKSFGPLLNFGLSKGGFPWKWTDSPWPWPL